jgi:hypothetical protein
MFSNCKNHRRQALHRELGRECTHRPCRLNERWSGAWQQLMDSVLMPLCAFSTAGHIMRRAGLPRACDGSFAGCTSLPPLNTFQSGVSCHHSTIVRTALKTVRCSSSQAFHAYNVEVIQAKPAQQLVRHSSRHHTRTCESQSSLPVLVGRPASVDTAKECPQQRQLVLPRKHQLLARLRSLALLQHWAIPGAQ